MPQRMHMLHPSILPLPPPDEDWNDVWLPFWEFWESALQGGFAIGSMCCRIDPNYIAGSLAVPTPDAVWAIPGVMARGRTASVGSWGGLENLAFKSAVL